MLDARNWSSHEAGFPEVSGETVDAPSLRVRTERRDAISAARLLAVTETDAAPCEFAAVVSEEDLLIVNDAATLPASLLARSAGAHVELRLVEAPVRTKSGAARFSAVLFGEGTYRTPTERRPPPPHLERGSVISFHDVEARVVGTSELSQRLVTLETACTFSEFVVALYRFGAPVQYAYVPSPLHLWDTQTSFARVPLAVEAPSATYLLPSRLPCPVAFVSHAAGLSATGDPLLDAHLPLPERYEVPARTVRAVLRTKALGGRVIAVGTSVTRALESSVRASAKAGEDAKLAPGKGNTTLHIDGKSTLRVVDGIVTGVHDAQTSHRALLSAFVSREALDRAYARSVELELATHEFGDGWIVFSKSPGRYRNGSNLSR